MATRDYQQHCTVARSLDVIGERWTLLIVRELLLGPRRYKDLAAALPGMGTNLLAARLKQLAAEGLLEKTRLPAPASADAYALTASGRALEPVVLAIIRWGLPRMGKWDGERLWSAAWTPLTFKALFDRAMADTDAMAEFAIGDERFHVGVRDSELITGPGPAPGAAPDVTVTSTAERFLHWARRAKPPSHPMRGVRIAGDAAALDALMRCFPMPSGD